MALGFQARAMLKGLAKLGEPSVLAGVDVGKVVLERDVELFAGIADRSDDNPVVRFTTASIDASFNPKVGQALTHPDGAFMLDRLIGDNGYVRRFIVVAA